MRLASVITGMERGNEDGEGVMRLDRGIMRIEGG